MKRKGYTLIEVIVSLAIIGLIAVSMLNIFSTSLLNIVNAGARSETVNKAEQDIEMDGELINSDSVNIELPSGKKGETATLGVYPVEVNGELVKGSHVTTTSMNGEVKVEIYRYNSILGSD